MFESKTSVPVYLNFFNRPDTFQLVFDAVREARPAKLFLSCDGPRDGRPDDVENVKKCQEIAEAVDWDCEVHKNYSDKNLGCGMRMYTGITWAFESVDRLMVLEDDCVPSQDFFPFCEELLEKYKDDNRIGMINAMNHLGTYTASGTDYFFGQGSCWGWASWKRVWENMDYSLKNADNEYNIRCIARKYPYYSNMSYRVLQKKKDLSTKGRRSSWAFQFGVAMVLQMQTVIVPSVNMISNIGLTADSAHAVNNLKKLNHVTRQYFNAPTYPMHFPLRHPQYVVEDWFYSDLVAKKFKVTHLARLEGLARQVIYADKGEISKLLKKIPKKLGFKKC